MSIRSTRSVKKAIIPPSPPSSGLEIALQRGAQVAVVFLGVLGLLVALQAGRFLFAPIALAIVVGLMLGPIALQLERYVPPAVSAAGAVIAFILIVTAIGAAISAPLSTWAGRVPQIWNELQLQLSSFSAPLATIKSVREEIRSVTGGSGVTVSVEDGSAVESVAVLAPALLAQMLIFFASLYFFLATRHDTRLMVLRLCSSRKLRRRAAYIFRDVEELVANYLLAITIINMGLGIAVAIALWLLGTPSAVLWGALAGILNFVIYIGPALMAVILFGVGLASYDTFAGSLLPLLAYLLINGIEAQFVTPLVIGRRMTLNPFLVFLAVSFWLWMWGPIGGFIAIPALVVLFAIARNIVPGFEWGLSPERRRQYSRLP